jgi:hypothetical protein
MKDRESASCAAALSGVGFLILPGWVPAVRTFHQLHVVQPGSAKAGRPPMYLPLHTTPTRFCLAPPRSRTAGRGVYVDRPGTSALVYVYAHKIDNTLRAASPPWDTPTAAERGGA